MKNKKYIVCYQMRNGTYYFDTILAKNESDAAKKMYYILCEIDGIDARIITAQYFSKLLDNPLVMKNQHSYSRLTKGQK